MYHLSLVALGGGIGASSRHLVNMGALRVFGAGFPAATLAVNIAGCLLMGLLAGWLVRRGSATDELRLFLGTGVLGGFTTFSAFSLDAVTLWQRGAWGTAVGYVLGSVLLSTAALLAGLWTMRAAP